MRNYWLDGKDNYEIDREVGAEAAKVDPQFLDIGTGLRTQQSMLIE